MTKEELREKVKLLPFAPGVYIMKDKGGNIIYVGKSKCLHNRVSHYFQPVENLTAKTARLVSNIFDFECIYTASEAEALILENELIKRHSPKYNIKLKDAKTYPYIKINYSNSFPSLEFCRKRDNDNAIYFGPYTSSASANGIIDTLSKTFKIASCGKQFIQGKRICRPCLYFHLGQCCGPCTGEVSASEYSEIFKDVQAFLKGEYKSIISSLEKKMLEFAEKLDFENAAKYRDRIESFNKLKEHQIIINNPEKEFDVFGISVGESFSAVSVIFIRNGKVIDKDDFIFSAGELLDEYEICDFIERFYKNIQHVPGNILLSFKISDEKLFELSESLHISSDSKVKISIPERGEKKIYTDMANRNASEAVRQKMEMVKNDEDVLYKLSHLLALEVVPERIEAYDISNNGVQDMYGGMIVVSNAHFKKSDYRIFSVKELDNKTDDYSAMGEVLKRRLSYLTDEGKENASFSVPPDLILLDGGVGHVNTVKKIITDMGLDIPIFGMVKDDFHKTRTLTDGTMEISIAKDMSVFTFIYRIQEEVHRYTFSIMDASRNKRVRKSVLENIEGVGEARAKALIKKFKSIKNIKSATVEEISTVPGISIELAAKIIAYLESKGENLS